MLLGCVSIAKYLISMIKAFSQAVFQLGDISLRRVVWIALAGSAGMFTILWLVFGWFLFNTKFFHLDGLFGMLTTHLEWLTNIFGVAAVVFLSWLLFPTIASVIVSFFLEDVADAVEARHYPNLPHPRRQGITEIVRVTMQFSGLAVVLNMMALPVYVLLFFIGPFNLFIFYALNGYLFGREFFELVAHRRATLDQARRLRQAYKGQLFLAGVIIAFMMTVPIVNLIAPLIATAAMVHLTQNWRSRL